LTNVAAFTHGCDIRGRILVRMAWRRRLFGVRGRGNHRRHSKRGKGKSILHRIAHLFPCMKT
jgi:hypothetical protein